MKYIYSTVPALVILGIFLWFSNWIPQTTWEPPKKLQLSADLSPADLARFGETLVKERGCLTCHTIEEGAGERGRGRGPNFAGIGVRPRSTPKYLAESLYDPGAFVVEGYVNIMPSAVAPPARLSYEEATAVVNYLLSLGGRPSVKVGDLPRPAQQAAAPAAAIPAAPQAPAPAEVKAILNKYGCLACHALGGEGGKVGPALDRREIADEAKESKLSVADYIRQSIVAPGAYLAQGFPNIMPADIGDKMTARELEQVVKYLSDGLSK
ncbi:MAG: c-type cytochrome [Chloroflexi bacterium]|nr:c-type cytochrome [Chloroflexota bacterium]